MQIHTEGKLSYRISEAGEITCESQWLLSSEADEGVKPDAEAFRTEAAEWAGTIGQHFRIPAPDKTQYLRSADFLVTEIRIDHLDDYSCRVTFVAGAAGGETGRLSGSVSEKIDASGNITRSGVWIVGNDFVAGFRPGIGDLLDWSDDTRFVCSSVSCKQLGRGDWEVAIEAKELRTRMISVSRNESFNGFNALAHPQRTVTYQSVWKIDAQEISNFYNLTGTSPDWAGQNCIITSVAPRQISASEYEAVIEAQEIFNPRLHARYESDDRSDLTRRSEYSAGVTEMHLSPRQCGYYRDGKGRMIEIPDWDPQKECPFVTAEPLDKKYIDSTLRLVTVTERRFTKGSTSRHINTMIAWNNQRVHNASVGGCDGSYLRDNFTMEEIFDNLGDHWTNLLCVYRRAPENFNWNSTFWN